MTTAEEAPNRWRDQLKDKLKCKADLHEYMVLRRKYISSCDNIDLIVLMWLPTKKYCRLSFLQDIITEKKKYFLIENIHLLDVKKVWREWAVKNVWPMVSHHPEL